MNIEAGTLIGRYDVQSLIGEGGVGRVYRALDTEPRRPVPAAADSIQTLMLEVSSLRRAETFLRESGMLGAATDNEIATAPSKLEGLDVRLAA